MNSDYSASATVGFPSPAENYIEKQLDLNQHLISHPAATFFMRVIGNAMQNAGIFHNDLIIVDRAINPSHNQVVIAAIHGELMVKRLKIQAQSVWLCTDQADTPAIPIHDNDDIEIWGVVSYVVHRP